MSTSHGGQAATVAWDQNVAGPPQSFEVPATAPSLGPYRLVGELGAGGMGRVYKAYHTVFRRVVALKVLTRRDGKDEQLVARFRREARAAANLDHPNLVKVFEVGEDEGRHYLCMEYVEGGTIGQLIRRQGRLEWRQAAEIALSIAQALEVTHRHKLVHRDIKPSNILISKEGMVKLSDLGLVRRSDEPETMQLTQTGQILGTIDYMSPEQIVGARDVDIRSDLYALGCTLYQMLTGQVPFPTGTTYVKLAAHVAGEVPDVRIAVPEIPEPIARVVAKLTDKDPDNRFQSPAELAEELERLLGHAVEADSTTDFFVEIAARAGELEREKVLRLLNQGSPSSLSRSALTYLGWLRSKRAAAVAAGILLLLPFLFWISKSRQPSSKPVAPTALGSSKTAAALAPAQTKEDTKTVPPDSPAYATAEDDKPGGAAETAKALEAAGSTPTASDASPPRAAESSTVAMAPAKSDELAAALPAAQAPVPPKTIVVGIEPGQVVTLAEAFAQAKPRDTILIRQRGPLEFAPVDLTGKTPLTIVGDSKDGVDYWPIVRQTALPTPDPNAPKKDPEPVPSFPGLFYGDGVQLTLRKLHLGAAGPNRAPIGAVVACSSGRVELDQCTLTVGVAGEAAQPPGDPVPLVRKLAKADPTQERRGDARPVSPATAGGPAAPQTPKLEVILTRSFLRGSRLQTCVAGSAMPETKLSAIETIWAGGAGAWLDVKDAAAPVNVALRRSTLYNVASLLRWQPATSASASAAASAGRPSAVVDSDKCIFVAPYASKEPFIAWNPAGTEDDFTAAANDGRLVWKSAGCIFHRYKAYFTGRQGRAGNFAAWQNHWKRIGGPQNSLEADPCFRVWPDAYVLQEAEPRDYAPRFWRNRLVAGRLANATVGADDERVPYALALLFTRQVDAAEIAGRPRGAPRVLGVHQKDGPYKTLEAAFADLRPEAENVIEIRDSAEYVPKRDFRVKPGETEPIAVLSATVPSLTIRAAEQCNPILTFVRDVQTIRDRFRRMIFLEGTFGTLQLDGIHFRDRSSKFGANELAWSEYQQGLLRITNCTIVDALVRPSGYSFASFRVSVAWQENDSYLSLSPSRYCFFSRPSTFFVAKNLLSTTALLARSDWDGPMSFAVMQSTVTGTVATLPDAGSEIVRTHDNLIICPDAPFSIKGWEPLTKTHVEGSRNALSITKRTLKGPERNEGVYRLLPGPLLQAAPQFEGPGTAKDSYRGWRLKKRQELATMAADGGPVGVRTEYLPDIPDAEQLPPELLRGP